MTGTADDETLPPGNFGLGTSLGPFVLARAANTTPVNPCLPLSVTRGKRRTILLEFFFADLIPILVVLKVTPIRFTPMNGHRQTGPTGPFRATKQTKVTKGLSKIRGYIVDVLEARETSA